MVLRPFVFAILSVTAMDRAARAESCELARLLATVEMRSTEPQSNIHTVPVSLNGVTRFMVLDTGGAVTLIESTPIDYLDFASPESGLGSKIGLDATNKLPPETRREWGKKIAMDEEVIRKVTEKWAALGLPGDGRPIWK